MDLLSCLVLGLMITVCGLLVYGARAFENRWVRLHPPDDWDGTREEKFEEHLDS